MSDFRLPSLSEIERAAAEIHAVLRPTPQIEWPLLSARAGAEVWVKHENLTPVGAFKVRGGLLHLAELRKSGVRGVVCATRGNHGQSIAFAAGRLGMTATIVVPHGNSRSKNAAMRSLGAELLEHGHDFQAAFEYAVGLAQERALHFVASFARPLVVGVATAWWELLQAVPGLACVYVPIGMGSGICAAVAARDALGLGTRVVGVVAAGAPAYRLSFEARRPVSPERAVTVADGMACRAPDATAVSLMCEGVDRVLEVAEPEIEAAMRHYFTDAHQVAEGAGAAPLAALLQEREQMAGQRVGIVLSGGIVDADVYARILQGA